MTILTDPLSLAVKKSDTVKKLSGVLDAIPSGQDRLVEIYSVQVKMN